MVFLHLATGFEELEAITIYTVLKRGGVDIQFICMTENPQVTGARGAIIIANQGISKADYKNCEMIILPGGALGAKNLLANEILAKKLLEFEKSKKWIAAICAAPMVLGELGILSGHEATSYPGFEEHLKGANLSMETVVVSDNIVTSRGPGTALEFAFSLLEILKGTKEMEKIKSQMLVK